MELPELRREYTQFGLREGEADGDPFRQFRTWFDQAVAAQIADPNAMSLAAATPDRPPCGAPPNLRPTELLGAVLVGLAAGLAGRGFAWAVAATKRPGVRVGSWVRLAVGAAVLVLATLPVLLVREDAMPDEEGDGAVAVPFFEAAAGDVESGAAALVGEDGDLVDEVGVLWPAGWDHAGVVVPDVFVVEPGHDLSLIHISEPTRPY